MAYCVCAAAKRPERRDTNRTTMLPRVSRYPLLVLPVRAGFEPTTARPHDETLTIPNALRMIRFDSFAVGLREARAEIDSATCFVDVRAGSARWPPR